MRAVWRALQNETDLRWRLFVAPVVAVFAWLLWFDPLEGVVFFGALVVGRVLSYVFAHGQTRFRHRLLSIGFWTFGVGAGLFIIGFASRAFSEGQMLGKTVGGALFLTAIISLMVFGATLRGEAKRL